MRYVFDSKIHENVVNFVDAYKSIRPDDIVNQEVKLTGKALGHVVLDMISKLGLDLHKCFGVGTDGAAVMVSESCGAVSENQKQCCNSVRGPCFNHALNNSLA